MRYTTELLRVNGKKAATAAAIIVAAGCGAAKAKSTSETNPVNDRAPTASASESPQVLKKTVTGLDIQRNLCADQAINRLVQALYPDKPQDCGHGGYGPGTVYNQWHTATNGLDHTVAIILEDAEHTKETRAQLSNPGSLPHKKIEGYDCLIIQDAQGEVGVSSHPYFEVCYIGSGEQTQQLTVGTEDLKDMDIKQFTPALDRIIELALESAGTS